MNLLLPIAQSATAENNLRPSWLWVHPNGNLMVAEAIRGLNLTEISHIYLGILKEHETMYSCKNGLLRQLVKIGIPKEKITIISLKDKTRSQPETVAKMIKKGNIKGPIFIKDADNYFKFDIKRGNYVVVSDLNEISVSNVASKSYVSFNDNNIVTNIVEKTVISNLFCAGGYSFESATSFLEYYEKIKDKKNLYLSHVIYRMLLDDVYFKLSSSEDFIDWGTQDDWQAFREKFITLFIDLDGTLVENSGEYFPPFWGATKSLQKNVDTINSIYDSGKALIIITTSRNSSFEKQTVLQLKKCGIKYQKILFDILHSKRIVINDFSESNPYKTCESINIPRNSDTLSNYLGKYLKES